MKKLVAFLTALSILLCTSVLTYADTTSVTASLDPETGIISLDGSAAGTTTVRVTMADTELDSLSDGNMPIDIHQITSKGSLDYKFRLPAGSVGGRYVISVTDKNGTDNDIVFYFNKENAEHIVQNKLNDNLSETEFVNTVSSDAGNLGIDVMHEDFSTDVISLMYKLNNDYERFQDFYKDYEFCRAVASLSGKNKTDLENYLKKYQSTLGINYSECYENNTVLSDATKAELCDMLSVMDYSAIYAAAQNITGKTKFSAVIEALSALASVNTSESWKAFEKIYTIDFPFLKNNVVLKNTNYKAADAPDVFGAMLTKEFNEISDLKDNFNSSVKVPQNPTTTRPPVSGGVVSVPHNASNSNYEEIPGDVSGENVISAKIPTLKDKYSQYSDVHTNDWFYLPVSVLGGNGIVSGYLDGGFYPANSITRAEFTKLIVSAFSVTGKKTDFLDVSEDDWFGKSVSNAAGAGIVTGYDGYFNPNNYITRQDAAVILYRVADLLGMPYQGFGYNISDIDDVSVYALPAVGALYKNGIVEGVGGGRFMPQLNITRAEAVQLIYNVISDIVSKA